MLVWRGRALDKIWIPWLLTTITAIVWTLVVEFAIPDYKRTDFSSYETFFALVLNSSLAFLLVFRLNRSAERFWNARANWGNIVAHSRTLVSGVIALVVLYFLYGNEESKAFFDGGLPSCRVRLRD